MKVINTSKCIILQLVVWLVAWVAIPAEKLQRIEIKAESLRIRMSYSDANGLHTLHSNDRVLVGTQVSFAVVAEPPNPNFSIQSLRWDFEGCKPYLNWEITDDPPPRIERRWCHAHLNPHTDYELEAITTASCFAKAGIATIKCVIELPTGQTLEVGSERLQIVRPEITLNSAIGESRVDSGPDNFHLYSDTDWRPEVPVRHAGFSAKAVVKVPPGFLEGNTCFVQLVWTSTREKWITDDAGHTHAFDINGIKALDTEFPYGYAYSDTHNIFNTGPNNTAWMVDSPGYDDLRTYTILKIGGLCNDNNQLCYERFNVYLMFRPSGSGNSWVPLKRQDWMLKATARKSSGGLWGLDPGASALLDPTSGEGVDTDTHPDWDINARNRNVISVGGAE